jgi:hypothetical protein
LHSQFGMRPICSEWHIDARPGRRLLHKDGVGKSGDR